MNTQPATGRRRSEGAHATAAGNDGYQHVDALLVSGALAPHLLEVIGAMRVLLVQCIDEAAMQHHVSARITGESCASLL